MATETELVVVYVEDDERLARLTMQYLASHGVVVHLVTRGGACSPRSSACTPTWCCST